MGNRVGFECCAYQFAQDYYLLEIIENFKDLPLNKMKKILNLKAKNQQSIYLFSNIQQEQTSKAIVYLPYKWFYFGQVSNNVKGSNISPNKIPQGEGVLCIKTEDDSKKSNNIQIRGTWQSGVINKVKLKIAGKEDGIQVQKQLEGQYLIKDEKKFTYKGEIKKIDNKYVFDGYGQIQFKNGDKYDGYWKNGKMEGKGTYTWSTKHSYKGQYKNGKKHGQGTYRYPNKHEQVGLFQNGELKKGNGNFNNINIIRQQK